MATFLASGEKSLSAPVPVLGLPPTRDPSAVRRANRSAVLRLVRWHGPLSRSQISEVLDLGSATVFDIVAELIASGLLVEDSIGVSTGGRKPQLYRFNPGALHVIGVAMSAVGGLRLALTNLNGEILSRSAGDLPPGASPELLVQSIARETERLMAESGLPRTGIAGIGVAVPGFVDIETGVVIYDAYRLWHDVQLAQMAKEAMGLPVTVVNLAHAVALGEKWAGAGHELESFACVNVEVGLGMGMILDGRLYMGSSNMAGRIGHIIVEEDGPSCVCGKRGCLQTVAGGRAIAERAVRGLRLGAHSSILAMVEGRLEGVTANVVARAAAEGDSYAIHVVQEAGRYLGVGIAAVINLLNPQAVLVAGSIIQAGPVLFDAIREAVARRAWGASVETAKVLPVGLGADARSVGAAVALLETQLFL